MNISVSFPGGVAVDALLAGHTIHTDQPAPLGADTAVSPYDLFFVSIATCMGFYALRFCQERHITTEGLGLTLGTEKNETRKGVAKVTVDLQLPSGFPEKYVDAIRRAVDACAVKRQIVEPPDFELALVRAKEQQLADIAAGS